MVRNAKLLSEYSINTIDTEVLQKLLIAYYILQDKGAYTPFGGLPPGRAVKILREELGMTKDVARRYVVLLRFLASPEERPYDWKQKEIELFTR